jgi:hypothetical protein
VKRERTSPALPPPTKRPKVTIVLLSDDEDSASPAPTIKVEPTITIKQEPGVKVKQEPGVEIKKEVVEKKSSKKSKKNGRRSSSPSDEDTSGFESSNADASVLSISSDDDPVWPGSYFCVDTKEGFKACSKKGRGRKKVKAAFEAFYPNVSFVSTTHYTSRKRWKQVDAALRRRCLEAGRTRDGSWNEFMRLRREAGYTDAQLADDAESEDEDGAGGQSKKAKGKSAKAKGKERAH